MFAAPEVHQLEVINTMAAVINGSCPFEMSSCFKETVLSIVTQEGDIEVAVLERTDLKQSVRAFSDYIAL